MVGIRKENPASEQSGASLLEEKTEQSSTSTGEPQKQKELDLLRDLANYKLHLDIKESANMQALLQHEVYHNIIAEFTAQLKSSEADRETYIKECMEAQPHITKVALDDRVATGQLFEANAIQEEALRIMDEMKYMKDELIHLKAELLASEESKVAALRRAELMEKAAGIEKEKNEELSKHISELNGAILSSNLASMEMEKVKTDFFSGMEAELEIATTAVLHLQKQIEALKRQLDMMEDLEKELLAKTVELDYLTLELKQAKQLHYSSSKVSLDAIEEGNRLKSEMELIEKVNLENLCYIASLEGEVKPLEHELESARQEVHGLNRQVETLMCGMRSIKDEISKSTKRELGLQVEIATLKSEVHRARSRIAAAEAAEARAMSAQAGLYLAVQQLAVEAQAAKNEARRLKFDAGSTEAEKTTEDDLLKDVTDVAADSDGSSSGITISVEEYESLIQKAEKGDRTADLLPKDECELHDTGKTSEVDALKDELEAAIVEIGDLRHALEEAARRTELAEKAKLAVEDRLRKWRKKQQQRRAASEATGERSVGHLRNTVASDRPSAYEMPVKKEQFHGVSTQSSSSMYDKKQSNYVPLGKVLNMKF